MSDNPKVARNCFEAHSFQIERCDCGCDHVKLYLIDPQNTIRAVATFDEAQIKAWVRALSAGGGGALFGSDTSGACPGHDRKDRADRSADDRLCA